ncbi:MAG: DegV family EDD domain-containing protein [Caldilineaceae bacterium]|nr:DegV family EDD domain-containing protein [Caldilineaceae bacterium]MBP8109344.1 DegV family EDD domain-containing protein [Caldilineaceae bacterium]MBP8125772.1 DegV family EDD domain-containing protein [Caldilineaceae bacterium]MBP9072269.1 DegV family EDD domain-containing protein [Caldilineaceae bacterium]
MPKVRIITDSGAYLTSDTIEKYGIMVIPHQIRIENTILTEDASVPVDQFFAKFSAAQSAGFKGMPELVAPDLNYVLDYYRRLTRESNQIVAIHTSSHLSTMWGQSRKAAELLMGRNTIRVIDSFSTSLGLGILVRQAAEAAEQGASVHEIARLVNSAVPHLYVTLFTESLNYLETSANLGVSQSVLGTMLGIKAMLTVEEGDLIPLEKVQARSEVVDKLYEFVVEFAHIEEMGILQHCYDQSRDELVARIKEHMPTLPVHLLTYPPSLAAHLGPNAVGVIVYEGNT